MIIRSQNKEAITDDLNLCISRGIRRRKTDKIKYFVSSNIGEIASYSTKEKAIEVLNLLEKEYKNRIPDGNTVFQMPADEEIEI